jgi:apolipoprotein N-acyltransferase
VSAPRARARDELAASPRGLVLRILAILVSAALYGLSFPPDGWPALAWVALVPFLVALQTLTPRAALGLAWLSGIVMAWTVTDFLPRAIATYYQQTALFGAALFVVVVTLMCCPSHVLFALWYRSRARPAGARGVLLTGAAWAAAELMRGRLQGNPWGTLAYTQAGLRPLVQIADVTGVYGVSFALVAVNAALAELVLAVRDRDVPRRAALRGLAAAGAVAAVVLGYGIVRLATMPPSAPAGRAPAAAGGAPTRAAPPGVRVAVVQGNVDLGRHWRFELYGENLRDYLRLTASALADDDAALVVWPENAMTFFVEDEPLYRRAIGRVLAADGAELLAGGVSGGSGPAPVYRNSAFLLAPSGEVVARYDKQRLLPFAEYFPLATVGFLNRRFGGVRQFTPGAPTPPLPTVAGAAAIVTCNEALFPALVATRVAAGAEIIVTLANDGWLGDRRYSARVVDACRLRAVEQRRYLVRAASSGGSAIVDPTGDVIAASAPFTAAVIAGTIVPARARTLYGRVGDAFALLCAAAVAASVGAGYARRSVIRVHDASPGAWNARS